MTRRAASGPGNVMARLFGCAAVGLGLLLLPEVGHGASPVGLPEGAEETAHQATANGSFTLPIGPWAAGQLPGKALTGAVETQSWRVPGRGDNTFALMQFLSSQLAAGGYKPLFECETASCGGFDFRYAAKLVPEPEMHVDPGDFRFLSAMRGTGAGAEYIALMVSRAGDTGFVQISHIGPGEVSGAVIPPAASAAEPKADPVAAPISVAPDSRSFATTLETDGSVVLDDLTFDSGAADLGPGPFTSLTALADYLKAHPDRQVVIVGHTDASGALPLNVALSRQRAQSVVDRLISEEEVPAAQLSADGVGFLAPVASNLTEEGRRKNRRVEAVLTSTR